MYVYKYIWMNSCMYILIHIVLCIGIHVVICIVTCVHIYTNIYTCIYVQLYIHTVLCVGGDSLLFIDLIVHSARACLRHPHCVCCDDHIRDRSHVHDHRGRHGPIHSRGLILATGVLVTDLVPALVIDLLLFLRVQFLPGLVT